MQQSLSMKMTKFICLSLSVICLHHCLPKATSWWCYIIRQSQLWRGSLTQRCSHHGAWTSTEPEFQARVQRSVYQASRWFHGIMIGNPIYTTRTKPAITDHQCTLIMKSDGGNLEAVPGAGSGQRHTKDVGCLGSNAAGSLADTEVKYCLY